MGLTLIDIGKGETVPEVVREIIRRSRAANISIWDGNLGGNPLHGADPGGVPPPVGAENCGKYPKVMDQWRIGLIPNKEGAKGGGD